MDVLYCNNNNNNGKDNNNNDNDGDDDDDDDYDDDDNNKNNNNNLSRDFSFRWVSESHFLLHYTVVVVVLFSNRYTMHIT